MPKAAGYAGHTLVKNREPEDVRSLCRAYTKTSVRVLGGLIQNKNTPPGVRVAGISLMLERGWGPPPRPMTGADGETDIRITIRTIVEGNYDEPGITIDGEVEPEIITIAAPEKPEPK